MFKIVLLCVALLAAWSPIVPAAERPVLVLGDSLSAAYHIPAESGWVALLAERLKHATPPRAVINASISGETSAGGLQRVPEILAKNRPGICVVELGANDGLRGLPLEEIRGNVRKIVSACREASAKTVLLGIELPINYGTQYRTGLRELYRDVAREFNVPLVPFLLAGVADKSELMQEDGLHPLAAAQPQVLDNVWPVLAPVLGVKP